MTRVEERTRLVGETMARVRGLETERGVTRESVEAMRDELIDLARHGDLFSLDDFPPPAPGTEDNNRLYQISEQADRRFALYVQSSRPGVDVPPHNHTTWAVIVGLEGIEENRFYERAQTGAAQTGPAQTGPAQTGGLDVGPEVGVAFLPDDLHSIHIHGEQPVINFHMYGLALDQLHEREYWSAKDGAWKIFPAQQNIIDRRGA